MSISYISQNAVESNSITMPAHQAGDLLIMFASRNGSTTAPTVPVGWSSAGANAGTNCAVVVACKYASSDSETSGTWTNATQLVCHVYRGASFIIRKADYTGTSTTVSYAGITTMTDAGNSWGLRFAFHSSSDTSLQTAPTAFTNRSNVAGTNEVAGHDTNGAVASVSFANVTAGGTSGNFVTQTIELLEIKTANNSVKANISRAPVIQHTVTGTGTLSVTIESGEALVFVAGTHQGDITSVAFNGTTMTEVCAANTAQNETVHIFYLATPDTGTHDLTWSASGTGDRGCALVISGQATTGQPVDFNTIASGTYATQASTADNTLYVGGSYGEASLTTDTGFGLTEQDNYTGASYENFACATASGNNGFQWFHWTQSSGQRNCIATVAIKGSGASDFPIQLDSITNSTQVTSASSQTVSHTVGTLTNGVLVAHIGLRGATVGNLTVSGVTWNGSAMTKLRSDLWNSSTYVRTELWYIADPASGTHDCVVSATGSCDFIHTVVSSWQGVDQATSFQANNGSGTITTAATSVTTSVTPTANNNVVLDSIWTKDDTITSDNSNTQWEVDVESGGRTLPEHCGTDYHNVVVKRQVTAVAVSLSHSWTNSEGYAHSVGVLKASTTVTSTKDNSAVASISVTESKNNSAKANILVAGNTADQSSKTSIVTTNSKDNSAKASVVTVNINNSSSKANFLAVYSKVNNATASIVATGQQALYATANIDVDNITNNNSVKASIVILLTNSSSAVANVLVAVTQVNNAKANIIVQGQRGDNLVTNSGFENGLTGWSPFASGTSTVTSDTTDHVGGAKDVKIAVDASNSLAGLINTNGWSVVGNIRYKLEFWYRSDVAGQLQLQLRDRTTSVDAIILQADGTWSTAVTRFNIDTTTSWQKYELEFTTYNGQTVLSLGDLKRSGAGSQASKTFFIDDVFVYPYLSQNHATANIVAFSSFDNFLTANISYLDIVKDNSTKASIALLGQSLDNFVTASIVSTGYFDNSAKASLVVTSSFDSSAKASIVVANSFNVSAKSNFLTAYSKVNSSSASIVSAGQVAQYSVVNILRVNEIKDSSVKASIVVTNIFAQNAKASLVVTNADENFVKSDILASSLFEQNAKASIIVTSSYNNNVKADIKATLSFGNNVKFDVLQSLQRNFFSKADIFAVGQCVQYGVANILTSFSTENFAKAFIVKLFENENLVKASLGNKIYTKGSSLVLPTDDANEEQSYTSNEVANVSSVDANYVEASGLGVVLHLFKDINVRGTDPFVITWRGKTDVATFVSVVYLQIFNRTTQTWETLASNNTADADEVFQLSYRLVDRSILSNYYDANFVISCRIVQE